MLPKRQGAIRLIRVAGIDLFLHWSWFLVAVYEIQGRGRSYSSLFWNLLEYLSLFLIVTLHEFGHALACRSVGGTANQIVLWPLGGVAYVDPPQRPGAMLWSIAAGPLVNVVLAPVLIGLLMLTRALGLPATAPDAHALLKIVAIINFTLLIFNLLPVYPLDGGQIVRSLLWFWLGRARSLLVATIIGFVGVAGLVILAVVLRSVWLGILAAFIVFNCWAGMKQALALARLAKLPRRDGFACPSCHTAPPTGAFWLCGSCQKPFDTFESGATCPNCGAKFEVTRCLDCGRFNPLVAWSSPPVA
jgi:Zn-dependent protease/predicted RNA-binding Zn-ribbon protein involved in translation (DUF1610 family)